MSSVPDQSPASPVQFVLAQVGNGAWAVGDSRGLISGAVLRNRVAAVRYISALAAAAGFIDVSIVVRKSLDHQENARRATA